MLDSCVAYKDIDDILTWHLRSNHFPPVPISMLPICREAIAKANKGIHDDLIKLPDGVSYRGSEYAPVEAIIEQHHLDSFLGGIDNEHGS